VVKQALICRWQSGFCLLGYLSNNRWIRRDDPGIKINDQNFY
jgi:hypothetical protein